MRWAIVLSVAALTAAVTTCTILEVWAATTVAPSNRPIHAPVDVPVDIERRILQLPEDGDVWHTSLFLHDDWQAIDRERQLMAWFETDPQLASLKAQTKWHLYTDENPLYHDRFRETVPILPAVVVQRSSGEVIYKSSGPHLPQRPGQLARDISATINRKCSGPWCEPVPRPLPEPPEPVVPEPDQPAAIPDTSPRADDHSRQWLLAAVIAGFSLLSGVAVQWRKTHG